MFSALHGYDMQRPVRVCMQLNECLPLFLSACPVPPDDSETEGGSFHTRAFLAVKTNMPTH